MRLEDVGGKCLLVLHMRVFWRLNVPLLQASEADTREDARTSRGSTLASREAA